MTDARRAVEAVWRSQSARLVGALARYTRDFPLAEDLAQEALAEALVGWAVTGIPDDPAAWLLTVGRRRAIDTFRRRAARDERYLELARGLDETTTDALFDPDSIDDDVLALMFTACHPALSRESRIALTLRVIGGLTTEEIAKAFIIPVATVQARITRAKKVLADQAYETPGVDARAERLGSVLSVIYLTFTEGSSASKGDAWIRTDLAEEALRLSRVLVRLAPGPEVFGLLALMELTAARFPARVDADGRPVLLEHQDRDRWDRSAIGRGRAALKQAARSQRGLGPYGLQAAIAECHAVAASVAETDWEGIVTLYELLGQVAPSPIVDLNRAVAVSMATGPAAGLAIVETVELPGSYLLPAVRAELLARLGSPLARTEYLRAAALCGNAVERRVLMAKAEGREPLTTF